MPRFNVMLIFTVVPAECDPTDPNGTPKQIAAQAENLVVELVHEHQGVGTYEAVLTVEAARADGLTDHLIGLFSHLPYYETGEFTVVEAKPKPGTVDAPKAAKDARDETETGPAAQQDQAPTGSGPGKPFRVQCYFKSGVPFEVLKAGFVKHVAVGNLVSNATMGGEYVAFVKLNAISADYVEDVVLALLAKAFDAETEESALNFRPIKTQLI